MLVKFCVTRPVCLQAIWQKVEPIFKKLCPKEVYPHLNLNIKRARFSCNLINKGLTWHHDFKLKDDEISVPGMTCVLHLGSDPRDIVYVTLTPTIT